MTGVVGCILGFLIVIYLVYKDWSVYLATFIGVCMVVLLNRLDFVSTLTVTYVEGVYTAIKSFFFLMLFGCLQSYLYRESGAAFCIADTIMKKLIRRNAGNTQKNLIGMLIILTIGTILNLGGIIAGVVIVLMYPIALAVFERCDIPKKFILGILGAGCYTFTLTIPGSPQVTNVAAMSVLGTGASVALIPGLVGAAVEIVVILLLLNLMINKARKNGEHFMRHELDPVTAPDMDKPLFLVALIPMAVLFLAFNALSLHIVVCLLCSCLLSIVLFWPQLKQKGIKSLLNQAAAAAIPMTMTVGGICGFANVITNTEAFQTMLQAIVSIELSPILICVIVVALLCMLTGGSSTGQLVALPQIAPKLMEMGLHVNIIHRVSVFAATTLDSMPYCGSILMLLPMCHMKLKEVYPSMFITTVVATTCGTVAVAAMCAAFPGLA